MIRDRFQELRSLFEELKDAAEPNRSSALRQVEDRDPSLADELRRMLAAHESGTSLLDHPVADRMLANSAPRKPDALAAGASLGPYRIRREVGRGGMGVVYEAARDDGSFERRVAIKVLRNDRVDELFLDRFHQERRILAQLNHRHIASILDAGSSPDGDPYFVMEYVEGIPITHYSEQHRLNLDQRLELFQQVCEAVEHAHRNLTVHRDLKPANILVTAAGGVKLLDFGIAKLLRPEDSEGAGAATVAVLTPEYTSPEQIRREPITTAADVFTLGILLYELLSGVHPFRAAGALSHDTMRAVVVEDPTPPSMVAHSDRARLRGEVDAIVLTALRKSPEWRYPSVAHLAADIGRFRNGWPVLAKGDSLAYRIRKFTRRHWLPLLAATATAVLLLASAFLAEQQARRAETARGDEERQRLAADQSRNEALAQRKIAEARTQEAESEKRRENERYRQLRAITASLLFDLHDGIRDLAGSSTARRLIVAKAKQELEVLSAESSGDRELDRDLAAVYERMGELRVDPERPEQAAPASGVKSFRRAVEIRRRIAAGSPGPADLGALALSLNRLGDGLAMTGDTKQAMSSYQEARQLAQSLVRTHPRDASAARALATIDGSRCLGLLTSGDTQGSLTACKGAVATLSVLAGGADGDLEMQRILASTEASYANALRLSRRVPEAVQEARQAVELLTRLEALAPSNAEYRRMSSSAGTLLALSLAAEGDREGSIEAFRRAVESMEVAVEIDPSDLGSPLRLAVTLMAFSHRLAGSGQQTAARQAAEEGLQLLGRASEKPGAGAVEWNEYANAMLKVDWPDLSQPQKALHLAEQAVAATKRNNPFFLDTLAWAYYRNGDSSKAADTERDALHLLPANAKGGLHDELEQGLVTFTTGHRP